MLLRVATFNCENLVARYQFNKGMPKEDLAAEGWLREQTKFTLHDPVSKRLTGKAVKAVEADIVALQEVENLAVVKRFRTQYLGGFRAYRHLVLVEGNDPRFIDLAVLSRFPIVHVRTYQNLKESPHKRAFIFSRDCLEVDIDVDGFPVSLFVNHFKSMIGGRAQTRERRMIQARTVKTIVEKRFGSRAGESPFLILGDLNDYPESDRHGPSGIGEIILWDQVENVIGRLPEGERWTHYYKGDEAYRQLDYILVSNALTNRVKSVAVERRGMPLRARRYEGARFRGVGQNYPKASDHCPVVLELELADTVE
jgi:endonuclease/exonuclease/phosphatase family metal-dependent hydrolase